ncbi:MAG: hypothetical protein N4A38_02290 [Candidatus Gracilibacteria bacterium]|nr:hypothetical protein [Candidatus Gracilibacteria bacterium]
MEKLFEKLIKLAKENNDKNVFRGMDARDYFECFDSELKEAKQELKDNNVIYLEDELGDLLWIFMNLLIKFEKDGLIVSGESLLNRVYEKFLQRINEVDNKNEEEKYAAWDKIKSKQKQELLAEHNKKYNN